MQTMFNVHEAKADFSNVLANIAKRRNVAPMKKYAGKVKIVGSMFDDTLADWEVMSKSVNLPEIH